MFHVQRWALLSLLLLGSAPASAQEKTRPGAQLNGGLQVGVAGQGSGSFWQETLFHGGFRGDALWGRNGPFTWGYGPMVGVSTNHFRDFNLAAGGSVLVPIHEYLPLTVQAGPYLRLHDGAKPGVFGTLMWGPRSYNYHGPYNMAGGVSVEGRVGFGDDKERAVIIAAHIDAEVLILPALFLINTFR